MISGASGFSMPNPIISSVRPLGCPRQTEYLTRMPAQKDEKGTTTG